jgi:hypothetical protein
MGRGKPLGRLQRQRTNEGDDDVFGGSLPSGGGMGTVARAQPV